MEIKAARTPSGVGNSDSFGSVSLVSVSSHPQTSALETPSRLLGPPPPPQHTPLRVRSGAPGIRSANTEMDTAISFLSLTLNSDGFVYM